MVIAWRVHVAQFARRHNVPALVLRVLSDSRGSGREDGAVGTLLRTREECVRDEGIHWRLEGPSGMREVLDTI